MSTEWDRITYVCGTCGAHLDGIGAAHACAAEIVKLRADQEALRKVYRSLSNMHPRHLYAAQDREWAEEALGIARAALEPKPLRTVVDTDREAM